MAREVSEASLTSRPAPSRRKVRPSANRRTGSAARSSLGTVLPKPRQTTEAEIETGAADRPTLNWVLVTDANGRTRPEARWV